jgi:hypothetical protein
MTEPPDTHQNPDRSEDSLSRILTEALHTGPPNPETLQRLHNTASREWVLAVNTRRSRPRPLLWSAAAALAILIVGGAWLTWQPAAPQKFGVVARTEAEGGEIAEGLLRHRTLKTGTTLNVGDKLTTHSPVLITLTAGGSLRIAPDTVLQLPTPTDTELQRGQIYLDLPPTAHFTSPFRVSTRAGTIEHVGTEFEVLSHDQTVRIRVREGRVRLHNPSRDTLINAGTQLTANPDGSINESLISPYGSDWLWVAALTPDYDIEGQPLLNFLQWAARELGRPVKFADAHAREVAERTILHGSVKGREPLQALSSVLSTTSLTYEIRGDTIWVQSASGT